MYDFKIQEKAISGLYYHYDRYNEAEIQMYLKKIDVVRYNKDAYTEDYYVLNKESKKSIIEKPYNIVINMLDEENYDTLRQDLEPYLQFEFLVKSTSRFIVKCTINEVLSQLDTTILGNTKLKAIEIFDDFKVLDDTDGEHFIATAQLLKQINND